MLLEDASVVFVPVIGMVGGIAAMAPANGERHRRELGRSADHNIWAPWSTVPNEPQPVVPLRSDRARCRAD
jgi:hypothetical protein